jgi:hypothetical protein
MSDEAYAEIADLRNRLGDAESQNQALQERIETLEAALRNVQGVAEPGCTGSHGYDFAQIVRVARAALSPTQETDRE